MATSAAEALALAPGEAEALATEAAAFARALPEAAARERYQRLAVEAAHGNTPSELVGALETMLELLLGKTEGPTARQPLLGIYARTPRGKALSAQARDVNRALQALRGQRLADVRVSSSAGQHTLVVETERCQVTLELTPRGVRIASLETG